MVLNNYMYIIILGGGNDEEGNLADFTLNRIHIFFEIYHTLKDKAQCKVVLSGGYRFSTISHSELVKQYILNKEPQINIVKEFIENNNTVDEAIHISNYFENINYAGKIIIITSSWHINRAKYLFNITFKHLNLIHLKYSIYENEKEKAEFDEEEKEKLEVLKNNPWGKWREYIHKLK